MPFGATLEDGGGRFSLWAPAARRVDLVLESAGEARRVAMERESGGWFRSHVSDVAAGQRYRHLVDGEHLVPDPASRFQPDGVFGPSEIVDPTSFVWTDEGWTGRPFEEAVFYETHVGAFSARGDYRGVVERLDHVAALGVTALELMPLSECPGARNWGYDGVLPYSPASRYGRPEELKRLVVESHARGLMVFLDVVYNHFGPEGNFLPTYAPQFFTARHATPWGDAIDFESPTSGPVRDYVIHNALYWLEEFHLDGLRLDAVHEIHDGSVPDVLDELAQRVERAVGADRRVHLVLENDRNAASRLVRDDAGRPRRYTAQWNDDQHHAMHVLLTGEREGYYGDYADAPRRHLGRCLVAGFAYQGEPSEHRGGRARGEDSSSLPPTAFVPFVQNHDQVGNRAFGERMARLAEPAAVAAAVDLLLLAPSPPLLFMGEEWGTARPFPFFCDFTGDLARAVREGRRREFAPFEAFRDPARREQIPDPCDPRTFEQAVLDWDELDREPHATILAQVRRALEVRRREIVPRLAPGAFGASGFSLAGASGLQVCWTLADGAELEARVNLAGTPTGCDAGVPPGRRLSARPDDLESWLVDGRMPPWSVGFWLRA